MRIRFRRFRPLAPYIDTPERYWIYPLCLGCYGRLAGIGIIINDLYYHINPICIIKGLILQKQEEKYRFYTDHEDKKKNDNNTSSS